MIVVTGAAGFIGSAFVWKLNCEGRQDVVAVDQVAAPEAGPLGRLCYHAYLDKNDFLAQVREDRVPYPVEGVVHLGACSATTERDTEFLRENNTEYTRHLAEWAVRRGIRFLYASSGATYGDGSAGFSDAVENMPRLQPLNPYGASKHQFDLWALETGLLRQIAGFKFFNVFGPNEYHKGGMVSGAYRMFHQVRDTGKVCLFRSEHPDYADGEQRRDFVYVKDCVDALWWFLRNPAATGLFNVGSGEARSWNDLALAVFAALGAPPRIEYIPLPETLRGAYQYYTEADLSRLRAVGYTAPFTPLEAAVADYVRYLAGPEPYLTTGSP